MIRNSEMKPVGSFFFPRLIVPITIFFFGVCGGGGRKRGRREKVSEVYKTYKKEEEEAAYQSGATIHLYCSS